MKNNFDQTAQYLQETDPVFRRSIKQGGGSDSGKSTKNATASQLNLKQGVGKTGVEFRWYPQEEYQAVANLRVCTVDLLFTIRSSKRILYLISKEFAEANSYITE